MDKRITILIAAETLLSERGFYGLSMKLLAQRADIAAGTIYCYFKNKDALLSELLIHINMQVANKLFENWTDTQSLQQKYEILWKNTFNSVLRNPQRLNVVDMLLFRPGHDRKEIKNILRSNVFSPLFDFYQQGIDNNTFHAWPIEALLSLSFDSAINLAKHILRQRLEKNEELVAQVRKASWLIIQKQNNQF
ncbi:TetR/AcrR family transcriptional regulator [Psychromonas sp. CD1]|uniref:TetR/AcrR family transcriptional regulator n=1 Tax=Psychromonas sp. CD1 TaxID=1979839 RepID=UPI0015DB821C|nr:TetR/AcrR family transcriptional regulator [Psychromonas sp. CD1]